MDSEVISQVVNVLIMLFITYGAVYFGQYRSLLGKIDRLATDLRIVTADGIVTMPEVDELKNDLGDLRAEIQKVVPSA